MPSEVARRLPRPPSNSSIDGTRSRARSCGMCSFSGPVAVLVGDRRFFHAQNSMKLCNRQCHLKCRAAAWPAGDTDATIVGHDDLLDQREPEAGTVFLRDRKSTRLNSSHLGISYAVFCLK